MFRSLFRGAKCRAEIAQFVVDLVGSADGFSNFFAQQSSITFTQPVHEIFYCRFLKVENSGKIYI